jgi:uncharacterized protein (UPF0335 family)
MKIEPIERSMKSLKEEYWTARAELVKALETANFNGNDASVIEANIRFRKLDAWKNRDPRAFK